MRSLVPPELSSETFVLFAELLILLLEVCFLLLKFINAIFESSDPLKQLLHFFVSDHHNSPRSVQTTRDGLPAGDRPSEHPVVCIALLLGQEQLTREWRNRSGGKHVPSVLFIKAPAALEDLANRRSPHAPGGTPEASPTRRRRAPHPSRRASRARTRAGSANRLSDRRPRGRRRRFALPPLGSGARRAGRLTARGTSPPITAKSSSPAASESSVSADTCCSAADFSCPLYRLRIMERTRRVDPEVALEEVGPRSAARGRRGPSRGPARG